MKVTKEQLDAFIEVTGDEFYWAEEDMWLFEAEQTADSIDDFVEASNSYAERTKGKFGKVAGFPFVSFEKVQVRKGDQRRPLTVIDFGQIRVALDCDLYDFLKDLEYEEK